MKRPAAPGSIEKRLRAMYPGHKGIEQAVARLSRAGNRDLSDLVNVPSSKIEKIVCPLFLVALRDKLADPVPQVVELNVTPNGMVLRYSERIVTLREENMIPQLEEAYNPMCEDKAGREDETEDGEFLIDEEEVEPEDDDEDASAPGSQMEAVLHEGRKEPMTMKLYDFEGSQFLTVIWAKNSPAKLLERNDYKKIWAKLERLWQHGAKAAMLTGTPGIGKTAFLIFGLATLMKKYKPVVVRTKGGKSYFFEPPERTTVTGSRGIPEGYRCYLLRNESILLDPAVYFLADGKLPDPPEFLGNALLTTTPLKDNFKEYQKDGRHAALVLPVWSAAEIALAWQEIFDPNLLVGETSDSTTPEGKGKEKRQEDVGRFIKAKLALTLDVVKERYRKWGGTPRYVLERPEEDLDKIIATVKDIQTTVEAMGKEIADSDHLSHKMGHLKVRPGYDGYEYMFASPYVTELAREKLKADAKLKAFLSFKGLQAHALNGFKGNIFQAEFMEVAVGRKKMSVRQVFQNIKKRGRDIPKLFDFQTAFRGVFHLGDVPASALPANRIIWPGSKIECAFDALKVVRRENKEDVLDLYQVTVSSGRNEHGLKYEAVQLAMKQLNIPASRTRIYIATTSELYPQAGYQKWCESGGKVLRDVEKLEELAPISQYALDSGI